MPHLVASETAFWLSVCSCRAACCRAAWLKPRAWRRSWVPWPGPWPQVHSRIPGAVTLFTEPELPLGTKLGIKEKLPPVCCLQDECKQRCFACETTKFCGFQRIPCTSPNTPHHPCFLPPRWLITCYSPTDLSSSSPTEKKQEQKIPPTQPQHPVGMPDVYIGFLEPCMEKSPDGQGINIIQARLLLFGV